MPKMHCPYCSHVDTKVTETRAGEHELRRRRQCLKCEKRFTTYERIESIELDVIKRNGEKQPFDREKVKKGIMLACIKRDIPNHKVENMIAMVEKTLRKRKTTEVPSSLIGELVLKKLKSLDKVAYLRFASIYQDFEDITDFKQEAELLAELR